MLHELIGEKMAYSLLSHASSELASACANEELEDIQVAFTKVCAYGMDLGLTPSKEAAKNVIQEVFDKMGPQKVDELSKAVKEKFEEESKSNDELE